MMQAALSWLLLFFLSTFQPDISTEEIIIGQTKVNIESYAFGAAKHEYIFVNLHENELTSLAVAKEYLSEETGSIISLKHTGKRNISFMLDGSEYVFDPNRMFTKKGRMSTLKLLNRKYPAKATKAVEAFSDKITAKIKDAALIIALHNNTNGNPLSVKSYKIRHVNTSMDPDDFILTTNKDIYLRLKAKNLNAVLETTTTSIDDGSLAYYCSKKNIPYINVEAEHGHVAQQLKMLQALTDIISNFSD